MNVMQVVTTYLVSHAVAVVTIVASVLTALRLFDSRRTPQSTFAWLLGVIFVPFAAVPLFFLIGARKFPRRAKRAERNADPVVRSGGDDPQVPLASVLRHSGVAPARPQSTFELLVTGEAAYERLLGLIANAETSIDLEIFILGDDTTGHAIVDALAARAKSGVSVRVIVDAVGSTRSHRRAAKLLAAVGAELRVFMPFAHSPVIGRTNLRLHRKLAVFDGTQAFAGGMNLANEYMGPPPAPTDPPRWRDLAAVTSGRIASDAEALFESDWVFCGGTRRRAAGERTDREGIEPGHDCVQLVPSGPDMKTDTVYDLLLSAIFAAKERIVVVTPYYVPDELLQHAMVLAARRGVETELVVPAKSNHALADLARGKSFRELHEAGVVIHAYGLGMVHAKAMVVDDIFAYVGSPNFDMRSLFLNYETALCVYSPHAIGQIRTFCDGLIGQSERPLPPARLFWVFEQVAGLLAPEL